VQVARDVEVYELKFQVYLLAENRLFREALSRILNKKGDVRILEAAPLIGDSEARIAELKPDILLADASVFGSSAIEIVSNLRKVLPRLRIIMIGMDSDREMFLHAVREGAQGYVLKDASAAEVAAAVRAVINHESVCPPSMVSILFDSVAQSHAAFPTARVQRQLGFSRREQQLIHMISEGLTNKEIATRLGLSQQTVKNHVHRMLRKAGASDRLTIVERWHEIRHFPATDRSWDSWRSRPAPKASSA
jgi:DNA-binding NarL/FixJ family response regulator